jgi:ribosomal-protein-alanine N-acetyltransferase
VNESFKSLISKDSNLVIETDRLVLEPITIEHADKMFLLLQDELLYKFIPSDPPVMEALKNRYQRWQARQSPDGKEVWLNWAAKGRNTPHYIGHFQSGWDEKNGFSIAYIVGVEFQKQGYAREAVASVISFLKTKMNAGKIKSWVDTRNQASICLMKRLGFEKVEVIKSADEFKGSKSDEYIFELKT